MIKLITGLIIGACVAAIFLIGADCRRAAEMSRIQVAVHNQTNRTVVVTSVVDGPAIPPKSFEVRAGDRVELNPWPYQDVPPLETNIELRLIIGDRTVAVQMSATDIAKLSTMHGTFLVEVTEKDLLVSFLGEDLVN